MCILDVGRLQGRGLWGRGSLLEKEIGFFMKVHSFNIIPKFLSINTVIL
jgi:hypothetical protein